MLMAKKLDYPKLASDIVSLVGGAENIVTLAHCMTRLRFVLKDESKAKTDEIKALKGVLGVVSSAGQYMVIMGQNLLPVYEACIKQFNLSAGQNVDENLDGIDVKKEKGPITPKSVGLAILGYVSASVTPMVPALIAGGMLKVFLILINLAITGFTDTNTYAILSLVADAPFYFMPILVAYGASTKLGSTPGFAMICAASLLHPNWTDLVAAGDPVTFLTIPVRLMKYSSSLLPALLLALCACYVEKLLNKIVPGIFKSVLVGLGTIAITMGLGFTIIAPVGGYLSTYLGELFAFLGDTVGPVAVGLLAFCLPWLIMCGMHTAFGTFMTQSLVSPGYDSMFRPAFLLHNMAEGGACIGVAIRTKDAELRSEALSIAFGCIVAGVSEPAIYGINLPRKTPMYGVMIGGAAGGVVAGLLGCRAYVMGYSTILALPIFEEGMIAMLAAVAVAIVVAALVVVVLGFKEE
jgi:PTS system beta-glucosides-specific IIC component